MNTKDTPAFADLLRQTVEEPGIICKAYSQFHSYSIGNQLLAWVQCLQREIPPGPIATFQRWKELGRHVKKGEKALMLCMPVTVKRKSEENADPDQPEVFTRFVYRNNWFVLAQTDGQALPPTEIPSWNRSQALAQLGITEIPFDVTDGNVMGYARERSIAVSSLNPLPHKTTFHECAHVLLGHTTEGAQQDGDLTPRSLKECEAESVALLCCAALDLPGVDCARGYFSTGGALGIRFPSDRRRRS